MLTPQDFDLFLFTDDPLLAGQADAAGVRYIGPDLEYLGKHQRQGGMNTWISSHSLDDLAPVFAAITPARRFIRCNPVHDGLGEQLEAAIDLGSQAIMLPYFRSLEEATYFIQVIGNRARKLLLVETLDAARLLPSLVNLEGVDQIHIGLNDLRLDAGYRNHFELLCSDWMIDLCAVLAGTGQRFGFGGIGRALDTSLPIPADLVYAQYPRLGANAALLSRVFTTGLPPEQLPPAITACMQRMSYWFAQPPERLEQARQELLALSRRL